MVGGLLSSVPVRIARFVTLKVTFVTVWYHYQGALVFSVVFWSSVLFLVLSQRGMSMFLAVD